MGTAREALYLLVHVVAVNGGGIVCRRGERPGRPNGMLRLKKSPVAPGR